MTARSPWSCILWDVDGTIVDASDGILERLTRTLTDFGLPAPTREELVHWIGPPLHASFQQNAGLSPERAAEAVIHYRAISRVHGDTTGARTYPGIAELIADLAATGVPQATASSKPENQVQALMEHFGIAPHLQAIVGESGEGRTLGTKTVVIAESLQRLRAAGHDTSRPILVGDRHHDVDGAAEHGIPVIFVRWGFSWPHESEGAHAAVDDVAQLRRLLLVDTDD